MGKEIPFGLVRLGVGAPQVSVGDVSSNVTRTVEFLRKFEAAGVALAVFPELGISGYTCGDLFHQSTLLKSCLEGLQRLVEESSKIYKGCFVAGVPLMASGQLYNCAVAVSCGRILGVVPKVHLPNYKEFYERRWFAPGQVSGATLELLGHEVPFGFDLIFACVEDIRFRFSIEICEDLWMPVPPSSKASAQGALIICNPSASNEVAGKADWRRTLVTSQSGRCLAAYAYAGAGPSESTTDLVFGGHCMVAESGTLIGESAPFAAEPASVVCDVDLEKLQSERLRMGSFQDVLVPQAPSDSAESHQPEKYRNIGFSWQHKVNPKGAPVPRPLGSPFVPEDLHLRASRCNEIFQSQIHGLAKRLQHLRKGNQALKATIGVSGGLDSTLALLVVAEAADLIAMPRSDIIAMTMPGFGTTDRTLANARLLMLGLGITSDEVDIRSLALEEMRALGHHPFGIDLKAMTVEAFATAAARISPDKLNDLTFENVQARIRTSVLMNKGFVIGTGDLSELALGWCTYNADHMSMYNPNSGVPKTLVRPIVDWVSSQKKWTHLSAVLQDVLSTEISPELLPTRADGSTAQKTEDVVGPYELHDFFLFYFARYGFGPEKILYLASHAKFSTHYPVATIRLWLRVFLKRFFSNQYKRSALPDGPKVGTVSLSPRGDWRMPSDADYKEWIEEIAGN